MSSPLLSCFYFSFSFLVLVLVCFVFGFYFQRWKKGEWGTGAIAVELLWEKLKVNCFIIWSYFLCCFFFYFNMRISQMQAGVSKLKNVNIAQVTNSTDQYVICRSNWLAPFQEVDQPGRCHSVSPDSGSVQQPQHTAHRQQLATDNTSCQLTP